MQCYYYSDHYMTEEHKIVEALGKHFELYLFRDHPNAKQICTWDCHLRGKYRVLITKYMSKVEVNIQDASYKDVVNISAKTLEGALKKTKKIMAGLMLLG